MQIIPRRNESFNIAATYYNTEGGKITKPTITILPKSIFQDIKSVADVTEDLIDRVSFLHPDVDTVEELENAMLEVECRLLKNRKEVV